MDTKNDLYLKILKISKIYTKKDEIHIIGNKKIICANIKTAPYPGVATDIQAQLMVLFCKANKKSIIEENIFENDLVDAV